MAWPEDPAFVLIARDKAPWVAECVRSVLAQTYTEGPLTYVFSDQGSTDGTREIIEREVQAYNGPHEVKLLSCPDTEFKGMAGLIRHLNWLHSQLDHDLWIQISADDIAGPERVQRTMETIRELDRAPLFFGTAQRFASEKDLRTDETFRHTGWPLESKWVDPIEHLAKQVGGSSTNAWNPALLEAMHPLPEFALVDIYLPFCAAMIDSFYFLAEVHHTYVERPDPRNTGLEGRARLAANEPERLRWKELCHFQLLSNDFLMLNRVFDMQDDETLRDLPAVKAAEEHLRSVIFSQALTWSQTRADLTLNRIPPLGLPI